MSGVTSHKVEWFFFLEIGDFGTWIKLEWVDEAQVLSMFDAEQECLCVFARREFFFVYLNYDGLKVVIEIENFEFVVAWLRHFHLEIASVVYQTALFTSIDRHVCILIL